MERIERHEVISFQKALQQRMVSNERVDLFPVIGFLCQLDDFNGEVLVDKKDAATLSLICATFSDLGHLIRDHTDDNEIHAKKYISLHIWCESVENINWSLLNEFFASTIGRQEIQQSSTTTQYTILSTNYQIINTLQSSKHFEWNLVMRAKANLATNPEQRNSRCFLCPEAFYVKPLTHEDTLFVLKNYKYATSPTVRKRLLALTSLGKSVGIFEKRSDDLTAWAFLNWDSTISALFTLEKWRLKGLGLAIVSALIERCCLKGYPVYCMIEKEAVTAETSTRFFKKFGFQCFEDITFAWCDISTELNLV